MSKKVLGVIGGSGFSSMGGAVPQAGWMRDTPYGLPSSQPVEMEIDGTTVIFLARHGVKHHIPPSQVNSLANLFMLKQLGVTHVISVTAVGSLELEIEPGHFCVPNQFIDKTSHRLQTYFDFGNVAHVSLARPVCSELSAHLARLAKIHTQTHELVCSMVMEGPQFSTKAESQFNRKFAQLIGMTVSPEYKLARELELCFANLALVTDYDCWHNGEVTAADVQRVMKENVTKAQEVIRHIAGELPACKDGCANALDGALMTAPDARGGHPVLELREELRAERVGPS